MVAVAFVQLSVDARARIAGDLCGWFSKGCQRFVEPIERLR
jgi:hypothetical protein